MERTRRTGVDDDATAAGGTIRIERDGVVGGRAWLAGGEIVVNGTVGRLRAAGGRVTIEGTVRGDVSVQSRSLEIGPTARIAGEVFHRGPQEPRIDPAARIGGRIEHQRSAAPRRRVLSFIAWLLLLPALFLGAVVPGRLRGKPEAAPSKGALVLRLLAALVVLGILRLVPILDGLVSLAALVFGLGGLSVRLYRTYSGPGRAQPSVTD
jgi:hypothetical protein